MKPSTKELSEFLDYFESLANQATSYSLTIGSSLPRKPISVYSVLAWLRNMEKNNAQE